MPLFRLTGLVALVAMLFPTTLSHFDATRDALPPPGPKLPGDTGGALLVSAFNDGSLEGWRADREGVWSVRHGLLRADLPDQRQAYSFIYAGSEEWRNYALDFDVCGIRGVDKGAAVRVMGTQGVGVDLRGPGYQDVLLHRGPIPLGKARVPNGNGTWHHVRIEAKRDYYRVLVDGTLQIVKRDKANHRPRGRIAFAAYTGAGGECTVYYDNVVVTPLDEDGRSAKAVSPRP